MRSNRMALIRLLECAESSGAKPHVGRDMERHDRVHEVLECFERLRNMLPGLDANHRAKVGQKLIELADAAGIEIQELRQERHKRSSRASKAGAIDVVLAAIGTREAVNFGPRRGMTTVVFERVTGDTIRIKMPAFWAVFKNGHWHRGPGVLRVGAMVPEAEVAARVMDVMRALKRSELHDLDRMNCPAP